jgi:type IV secretory pathway VirB10-like protein
MAIAERTILDPEPSRPGIPLKKSTLAVLALLVLGLGLVSSLALSNSAPAPQAGPTAKDVHELKKVGSDQVLKDEEAEAARLARARSVAASVPHAAVAAGPLPPARSQAMLPLPAGVRRDDDASAFFDRKSRAPVAGVAGSARDKDLELEAQTRMAKAVVTDFDPPQGETVASGAARVLGAAVPALAAATQAPSSAVAGQIDAVTQQLRAAQAAQAAAPKSREDWVREYARDTGGQHGALTGYQAPSRLVLRQGKTIPAVLGRQINSDLPGRITAYVSSNVYDADGRLLIPMGASLIGKYDAGVQVGQSRLMFAFERLVLPDGYSFDLPAAPGADLAGAAGMSGNVDNHFFKMFGTSLLIAVLADRVKQPSNVTQVGTSGPTTAAGQVLADVSRAVLERNRVIPPTITIDQGTRINVEVMGDMVFPHSYPLGATP